jgi:hypothetical protein
MLDSLPDFRRNHEDENPTLRGSLEDLLGTGQNSSEYL